MYYLDKRNAKKLHMVIPIKFKNKVIQGETGTPNRYTTKSEPTGEKEIALLSE